MNRSKHQSVLSAAMLVGVLIVSTLVSGCRDDRYFTGRDTVTDSVGDSVRANKAIHAINPWPGYSKDPNLKTDGKRVLGAVERYQEGGDRKSNGSSSKYSAGGGSGSQTGGQSSSSTHSGQY